MRFSIIKSRQRKTFPGILTSNLDPPDWPDFPMMQSSITSPADDDQQPDPGIDSTILDAILNVADYCSEDPHLKQLLPNSPHSVLEQVSPPPTTSSKEDADSMEDDDNDLCNLIHESLDYSPMESEFPFPVENADEMVLSSDHQEEFIGCRLFHLLLAGAEAMFSQTLDLARVILFRLRELSSCSSTCPVFQRIAFYFTEALQSLLDGTRLAKVVNSNIGYLDTLTAFQALHEASPYIKFGHYVANQAILEAIGDDKRVHIIDYDVSVGIQWPSLMQALAMRDGGSPHLRITAVCRPHGMRCCVQSSVFVPPGEDRRRRRLQAGRAEADQRRNHHRQLHASSPKLLTFVEEEVMSVGAPNTVEKFFQALHHYSAVLDSLEASLCETTAHILVERAFLATRIKTALIALASQSHQQSQDEEWSSLLHSAGFEQLPLSRRNVCQAKLLLGLFRDGYQLEENQTDETMRLRLSWKSRPLMAASSWSCKNAAAGEELLTFQKYSKNPYSFQIEYM